MWYHRSNYLPINSTRDHALCYLLQSNTYIRQNCCSLFVKQYLSIVTLYFFFCIDTYTIITPSCDHSLKSRLTRKIFFIPEKISNVMFHRCLLVWCPLGHNATQPQEVLHALPPLRFPSADIIRSM